MNESPTISDFFHAWWNMDPFPWQARRRSSSPLCPRIWPRPPAPSFPRLPRKDGSLCRHAHAILVFAERVVGPLLLGAGRYRGYGLCRPVEL